VLWLQDILPDAAMTTGLLESGLALRAARALERAAYRSACRTVVISETFAQNLRRKGVPSSRLTRIYNPATVVFGREDTSNAEERLRILYMGNIGYSQGLVEFVRAFQTSELQAIAKLVITGQGELTDEVRTAISRESVQMLGLVDHSRLDVELARASVGLVSQRADIEEFNVPSKLMNLMAKGIPVLAYAPPQSESARIVLGSGGGWVVDSSKPEMLSVVLHAIQADREERSARGDRALAYAREHFHPSYFAERWEEVLRGVSRGQSAHSIG
jgi:colanic acid biosynthesis glycosyl transferase WcaI